MFFADRGGRRLDAVLADQTEDDIRERGCRQRRAATVAHTGLRHNACGSASLAVLESDRAVVGAGLSGTSAESNSALAAADGGMWGCCKSNVHHCPGSRHGVFIAR